MGHPAGQLQAFAGADRQQVAQQGDLVRAGAGCAGQYRPQRHQQDLGGAGGLHRHGQGLPRQAGIGVGENAAGPGAAQNAAVAPNIHRLDHRQPGQHQADPAGRRAFRQDGFAFLILAAYSAQAAQQRFDLAFRDAAEKRRIAQTERHGLLLIGLIGRFVGITTSFCLQA